MIEPKNTVGDQAQRFIQLKDGTQLTEYCYQKQFSHEVNIEAINDLLDVITRNIKLHVVKNDDGLVTDVEFIVPYCNDEMVVKAQNNVVEFYEIRVQSLPIEIPDDEFLVQRRMKLEKIINGDV
jgi:hypothetical protein